MFCPHCGTEVPDGKGWCPNCGTDMRREADERMSMGQSSVADGASPDSTMSLIEPDGSTSSTPFGNLSEPVSNADPAPIGNRPVPDNNMALAPIEPSPDPNDKTNAVVAEQPQMPSVGPYLALVVVTFLFLSLIGGFIALPHYSDLKKAVQAGDVEEARKRAKSVRSVAIVFLTIRIVLLFIVVSTASRR